MKKLSFIVALLCTSMMAMAVDPIYDTNLARLEGTSATATSGNAALAIDGNQGSRWETQVKAEKEAEEPHAPIPENIAWNNAQEWILNLGQERIFNLVKIYWEGAYGKSFTIDVSNNATDWSTVRTVTDQVLSGFPYEQLLEFDETTAQYVRFNGIARGTGYGYSFWEFEVYLAGEQHVTTVSMPQVVQLNQEVSITVYDQNDREISDGLSFSISPVGAGSITDGKYTALTYGKATITASKDTYEASAVVYNVETTNLALNQTAVAGYHNNNAAAANDGNAGSRWDSNGATHYDTDPENYEDWWYVDLGAKYDVLTVRIKWENARPNDFDIRISDNATSWTNLTSYNGSLPVVEKFIAYSDFAEVPGRYIGIWARHGYENLAYGISMYEFEVYGKEYDSGGATAIDNTDADVKAVKVIENGQLIIIKNGVRYNVLGKQL